MQFALLNLSLFILHCSPSCFVAYTDRLSLRVYLCTFRESPASNRSCSAEFRKNDAGHKKSAQANPKNTNHINVSAVFLKRSPLHNGRRRDRSRHPDVPTYNWCPMGIGVFWFYSHYTLMIPDLSMGQHYFLAFDTPCIKYDFWCNICWPIYIRTVRILLNHYSKASKSEWRQLWI